MTVVLSGKKVAEKIEQQFPSTIIEATEDSLIVKNESLFELVSFLKNSPEFSFNFLNCITAVDYFDHFEVIYHLTSMEQNHSLVVKTRCYGRENLSVSSITGLYDGANPQEREIYDLLGISFEGHPNMKRMLLWDGFQGHPLRKDYL
jgi:NADH-quinone oxidoreductase subunit C